MENILHINKSCIFTKIDDIEIILNIKTGKYLEINKTGISIIEIIKKEPTTCQNIVIQIAEVYQERPNHIKDQVEGFLNRCINAGIINEVK